MATVTKAIFLDADGVLNRAIVKDGKPFAPVSVNELYIPEEVKPCLKRLKSSGYLLFCITNKADIERGLMSQEDVDAIFKKMREVLPLDDVFICYAEHSDCYKPKPGLILSAAKKYNVDLTQSFMIGDRWRDIGAGQNAGCRVVWINRGYTNDPLPTPPIDFTARSLDEATQWILSHE